MQNAPTMLGQKMMNRQAPYGPVGMVSQNMSGNKKGGAGGGGGGGGGGSGVIGLKFDTATATAGMTFSNSDTTATAPSAGIKSAKANASTIPNTGNYWYWEFTVGGQVNQFLGFGLSSFVCNASNQVGAIANSVCYYPQNGQVYAANNLMGTYAAAALGDIIGFKLEVFNPGALINILKNGVVIANQVDVSTYISGFTVAWTPIFTANQSGPSATISNNVYSYAGYTPIGSSVTTVAASASVPAVADGAYDVYTFNASGTFTVASTGAVRALVIAGGGGAPLRGGGGAGGYLENGITITPQTYTVTVGAGGTFASNGNPSSIGSLISAVGGGRGGDVGGGSGPGASGGSGGGGDPLFPGPDTQPGGAGTAGQGFAGGSGSSDAATYVGGGGGGGAGGIGGNGSTFPSGNGGIGKASDITGTSIGRGGGGAGNNGTASSGGGNSGTPGTANTGGGGGGFGNGGGSGVVIIRVRARA